MKSNRKGKKRFVATGLIAGLTAGAGAGFLLEQSGIAGAAGTVAPVAAVVDDDTATSDTTDTATSDTTDTTDTTDDTDSDRPDRGARLAETLQPLVDDGTITQAQADAVIAALEAAGPIGGGHGGPGGRGGGARLETVATALGMTADELRTALADGATIREVATAAGVDPQVVVDAVVAEITAKLAERVTAGELTQEEADAKLAEVTTRATEMLDSTRPIGGRGGPGRPGDAPAPAATETDDATSVTTA